MNINTINLEKVISLPTKEDLVRGIFIILLTKMKIVGLSPIGIAFAGICAEKNIIVSVISLLIGTANDSIGTAEKYLLTLLLYLAITMIRGFKSKSLKAMSMGTAMFLSGLLSMFWIGIDIKTALLILPESVLVYGLFRLFYSLGKSGIKAYFAEIIILTCSLSAVKGIYIPYLETSISFFILLIFLMSICHSSGIPTSIFSGAVIGFLYFLNDSIAFEMAGMFAFSAMIASVLSKMGKIGTSTGFLCGMTISVLYFGSLKGLSASDIFAAPVMFAIFSEKLYIRIGSHINELLSSEFSRESDKIVTKLKTVAKAVCDLGNGVKIFSETNKSTKKYDIYNEVIERCCLNCKFFNTCFKINPETTYYNVSQLGKIIDSDGYLNEHNIPDNFKRNCIRWEKFLNEFVHMYEIYKQDILYDGETINDREIIAKQFGEISNVITDLSEQVRREWGKEEENECVFSVDVAIKQISKDGENECGDSITQFKKNKKFYMILCDGMGSGTKAKEESKMTAQLFEEFITAGVEKKSAVKMINSALALKADRESFSSVDILEIDLSTGDIEFLKIGSAESYLKRNKNIEIVSSTALPIGILDNIEVESQKRKVKRRDIIVMMSDGVSEVGSGVYKNEWIKKILIEEGDIENICEKLIESAKRKMVWNDDMTAIVIKIEKGFDLE